MLRAIWNSGGRGASTRRKTSGLPAYALNARNFAWHQRCASSLAKRPLLVTLDDRKIVIAEQELLDISGESELVLYCKGRAGQEEKPVRLQYVHGSDDKFPPSTRGFLYYIKRSDRRHVRFRLCNSANDFHLGSDLLRPNGRHWTLSWSSMVGRFKAYAPLLQMIQDDDLAASHELDAQLSARRVITTLSPQHLSSKGQSVIDISGLTYASPNINESHPHLYYKRSDGQWLPYPAGTKGVYYYRQSSTAPDSLGELRFRLCSDVKLFEEGSDLRLPSGLPWALSSQRLLQTPGFSSIREQLMQEGLLKEPLPSFVEDFTISIQSSLYQPFIVNLSHFHFIVPFQMGTDMVSCVMQNIFTKPMQPPAYHGRAVVQFEPYPKEYSRSNAASPPLFALRFLEFLTPVGETGHGDPSMLQQPAVGQLLFRRFRKSSYRPWGYSPREQSGREKLTRFVEQSRGS